MDTAHTAITEPVRRIEVFTGTGRRRSWSAEDKARIVAESLTCGESVCAVARRHGLSPQQLFGWRRQVRQPPEATAGEDAPLFVLAVVDAALPAQAVRRRGRGRPWGGADPPGVAYVYAPDRKAERPITHLAGFKGILQVDGYGGYRALAERGEVQLAFCWAHVRRFYSSARPAPRRSPARRLNALPSSIRSKPRFAHHRNGPNFFRGVDLSARSKSLWLVSS